MPWCLEVIEAFEWHFEHVYDCNEVVWHFVQTPPAPPWRIGNVWVPWYEIGVQADVVWHCVHAVG
jgi:hypothetical protein